MIENVPAHLRHQYDLYDRKSKTGINNSCNYPHKTASIDVEGNCMICTCDGWLPVSVGKIQNMLELEQVWQNKIALEIQKDVDDKKFTWCSVDYCGVRQMNHFMEKFYISINVDESCNLACPSCRRSKINRTGGPEYEQRKSIVVHLLKLLNKFEKPVQVMMSGNGDPFASLIYRPLILDLEPRQNLSLKLHTNGLLLKKLAPKMKAMTNIKELDISIDAGDGETYEKVRLGGKWDTLIENLDWVKSNLDCAVTLKFVLQKNNLHSLDNFVDLLDRYQFTGSLQRIENWGALDNFDNHNIFDADHPDNDLLNLKIAKYKSHPLVVSTFF